MADSCSILVLLCSRYGEWLEHTIRTCLRNARHPRRVSVAAGVGSTVVVGKGVRTVTVEPQLTAFAAYRKTLAEAYDKETLVVVVHGHTSFEPGWDDLAEAGLRRCWDLRGHVSTGIAGSFPVYWNRSATGAPRWQQVKLARAGASVATPVANSRFLVADAASVVLPFFRTAEDHPDLDYLLMAWLWASGFDCRIPAEQTIEHSTAHRVFPATGPERRLLQLPATRSLASLQAHLGLQDPGNPTTLAYLGVPPDAVYPEILDRYGSLPRFQEMRAAVEHWLASRPPPESKRGRRTRKGTRLGSLARPAHARKATRPR